MVATFGNLYGWRTYLDMVTAGFTNDLIGLNDTTPHDRRYHRLAEIPDSFHPVPPHDAFRRIALASSMVASMAMILAFHQARFGELLKKPYEGLSVRLQVYRASHPLE